MARRFPAEQWAEWVCEQQESGLSVAEFCRWIGVSQNAFYIRRRRLTGQDGPAAKGESVAQCEQTVTRSHLLASGLVPLTVVTSPVVEIDLPCGAVVRVPNEDRSLRRVLGILLEVERTAEAAQTTAARDAHRSGGLR